MSLGKLLAITSVAILLFGFANFAQAQRGPLRVNQAFRYLGHGQSGGYHWRTPGPCVGYYNPYSQHNSALRIGGTPQGAYGYHLPSSDFGYSNSFDHPSSFGQSNSAPMFTPGNFGSNTVDSVIDDSEPEEPTNVDDDSDASDELSELEAEVQSILNDSQNSNSDKKPAKDKAGDNPDETSLWPGFNEFGKQNKNVQGMRYPVRPPRTAKRYN